MGVTPGDMFICGKAIALAEANSIIALKHGLRREKKRISLPYFL
jgi:hypothetical protein